MGEENKGVMKEEKKAGRRFKKKKEKSRSRKKSSLWTLNLRDLRISEMTLDCDVIKKRIASDNLLVKVETIEFHNNCQLKSVKCV